MNRRVGGLEASPGSLHSTSETGQGALNQDISVGTVTEEPQLNTQQEDHNVVSCLNNADHPCGPSSLLHTGHRFSFLHAKRPGRGA
jgi:hypothetical protein